MTCDMAASRSLKNVQHFIRNGDLSDAERELRRIVPMVERMEIGRGVNCACGTQVGTSVAPSPDYPQNVGSKPESME